MFTQQQLWTGMIVAVGLLLTAPSCEPPCEYGDGACAAADPEPASGPQSGYFTVRFDVGAYGLTADEVEAVQVGGIAAYDLQAEADGWLSVIVQGHPEPGVQEVVVWVEGAALSLGEVFRYDPPANARFVRLVAVGASLTQGVQRGVPDHVGSLMSPPAQLARQLGGYFPLPLLKRGLFPQVGPADVGPPPDCAVPNITNFVEEQAADVIPFLLDPETGWFSYRGARVDPDLPTNNLAVGGSMLAHVLDGPPEDSVGGNFVSALTYAPDGEFMEPVETTQLEELETREPTLIISTDLFGNDVILGIQVGDTIDPANCTGEATLLADISRAVSLLASTGAEVFLATLPQPSLLPVTEEKRRQMLAASYDATEIEDRIDVIEGLARAANDHLVAEAAGYDNVHIVDLEGAVDRLAAEGLEAGGQLLTVSKFGGLLGPDGIHFSNTGYAMAANLFIDAINEVFDTTVPAIDLDPIARDDPDTPDALRAAGLDVDACY